MPRPEHFGLPSTEQPGTPPHTPQNLADGAYWAYQWAIIRWWNQSETQWPTAENPSWVCDWVGVGKWARLAPGLGYRKRLQNHFDRTAQMARRFKEAVRFELELHQGINSAKAMNMRIALAHTNAHARQCALELLISYPHCACLNCADEECQNCSDDDTPSEPGGSEPTESEEDEEEYEASTNDAEIDHLNWPFP